MSSSYFSPALLPTILRRRKELSASQSPSGKRSRKSEPEQLLPVSSDMIAESTLFGFDYLDSHYGTRFVSDERYMTNRPTLDQVKRATQYKLYRLGVSIPVPATFDIIIARCLWGPRSSDNPIAHRDVAIHVSNHLRNWDALIIPNGFLCVADVHGDVFRSVTLERLFFDYPDDWMSIQNIGLCTEQVFLGKNLYICESRHDFPYLMRGLHDLFNRGRDMSLAKIINHTHWVMDDCTMRQRVYPDAGKDLELYSWRDLPPSDLAHLPRARIWESDHRVEGVHPIHPCGCAECILNDPGKYVSDLVGVYPGALKEIHIRFNVTLELLNRVSYLTQRTEGEHVRVVYYLHGRFTLEMALLLNWRMKAFESMALSMDNRTTSFVIADPEQPAVVRFPVVDDDDPRVVEAWGIINRLIGVDDLTDLVFSFVSHVGRLEALFPNGARRFDIFD